MDIKTILIRLGTAIIVGALVGLQRETSHRPAGLRTHMLVAIGSALVMLTGE
ncbi:MAG: MgtC/SapB family protein, partial [Butyricicoccaceae bacterium]